MNRIPSVKENGCDHIIGTDGTWDSCCLALSVFNKLDMGEEPFNFCPKCGEKIEWTLQKGEFD